MDEGFGGDLPQPTLYEAQRFRFGGLQAALQASPSLAWSCSQCAIFDGGLAVGSVPTCGRAFVCGCAFKGKSRAPGFSFRFGFSFCFRYFL